MDGQKKEWRRAYGKYGVDGLISTAFGQKSPNSVTQNNSHRQYLTGQLIAEYKGVFGKHDINVLGGWSAEENLYEDLQGKRTNIVGNELPALNLGDTDGWSNAADENEWALLSGFMRASYAFAAKYLVEVISVRMLLPVSQRKTGGECSLRHLSDGESQKRSLCKISTSLII